MGLIAKCFKAFTALAFNHPNPGASDWVATGVILFVVSIPVIMLVDPKDFNSPTDTSEGGASRSHARDESYSRAQLNFAGGANDPYDCSISTENQTIVSFDHGKFWWKDDGRCAEQEQKKRDEDAKTHSYWSTTIRVDTDMDSSWLPDEERTCQTYPDLKGRVSVVHCDATANARHNIPVEFWGGVNRNTTSDWKCRREKDLLSDQFVCRAID